VLGRRAVETEIMLAANSVESVLVLDVRWIIGSMLFRILAVDDKTTINHCIYHNLKE
jgi:hypothetical protein